MAGLIKRGNTYLCRLLPRRKAKAAFSQNGFAPNRPAKNPLPWETPSTRATGTITFPPKLLGTVVADYLENLKTRKTASSVKRDISYLRESFGQICPALVLKNTPKHDLRKKRSSRNIPGYLEAACFEAVTTANVSTFIATQVRCKGLKPKTANRYREVLTRLYNWAMKQNSIRIAGDKNPVSEVECYKEGAPIISYLDLAEVDTQLEALANKAPTLQAIAATYIYAGLRREELCWLQVKDVDFSDGYNGVIRVRAKTIGDEFWEPKTKVNRVMPISNALKAHLDSYEAPKGKNCWYFQTPAERCRWDPDNLSGVLHAANEKVGLKWTSLDFRHTSGLSWHPKGRVFSRFRS